MVQRTDDGGGSAGPGASTGAVELPATLVDAAALEGREARNSRSCPIFLRLTERVSAPLPFLLPLPLSTVLKTEAIVVLSQEYAV